MRKYIFRLDDITPGMNWQNLENIKKLFDKYGIKPIIGVVPDNQDKKLDGFGDIKDFWGKIKLLEKKGWIIAQHGYQHKYETKKSGIIGLNNYSEFAGLSYEKQFEKIQKGKKILEKNLGTKIKWWMAPAHSFDKTTCKILKELDFKFITDGIALFPFEKYGLKWLPQQIWKGWNFPYGILFGVWTRCLHINNYDEKFFINLENFIKKHNKNIISGKNIEDINYKNNLGKTILNFLFKIYFIILINTFKLISKIKG